MPAHGPLATLLACLVALCVLALLGLLLLAVQIAWDMSRDGASLHCAVHLCLLWAPGEAALWTQ